MHPKRKETALIYIPWLSQMKKMKAVKIYLPVPFIILLKPCFNVIKITPSAEKAGIINQEVVCMYHNASFRH